MSGFVDPPMLRATIGALNSPDTGYAFKQNVYAPYLKSWGDNPPAAALNTLLTVAPFLHLDIGIPGLGEEPAGVSSVWKSEGSPGSPIGLNRPKPNPVLRNTIRPPIPKGISDRPPMGPPSSIKEAPAKAGASSVSGGSKLSGPVAAGTRALRIEHKGAAAKGFPGIGVTPNGGPTFEGTPYLYPVTGVQKNIVRITLQGSRYLDYKEANKLSGVKVESGQSAPDGYTWHHRDDYDPITKEAMMELVQRDAHEATYSHKGSVKQYRVDHKDVKYR